MRLVEIRERVKHLLGRLLIGGAVAAASLGLSDLLFRGFWVSSEGLGVGVLVLTLSYEVLSLFRPSVPWDAQSDKEQGEYCLLIFVTAFAPFGLLPLAALLSPDLQINDLVAYIGSVLVFVGLQFLATGILWRRGLSGA